MASDAPSPVSSLGTQGQDEPVSRPVSGVHSISAPGANPFDTDEASVGMSTASASTFTVNVVPPETDIRRPGLPTPVHLANRRSVPSPLSSRPLSSASLGSTSASPESSLSPPEISTDNITAFSVTPPPLAALPPAAASDLSESEKEKEPIEAPIDEKAEIQAAQQRPAPSRNPFKRLYHRFRATYCPITDPAIILPTCPTDVEKRYYVHTNRIPLYVFGVFSFLSLGAGMWLFALSSVHFYWYGVFSGAMCIYLGISYVVGIIGRDWDEKPHTEALENFATAVRDEINAPTVDVFLPCCREPYTVIQNTYRHIVKLQWPASRLKVHVLDDGDDPQIAALAKSFGFNYIVRDDRPRLRKAGNLRWAFSRTQGEFFAIFDADFCPRPDFLIEMVSEHLANPDTAIVQSPQFFRVLPEQTWVEQGAGATQELFYRVVQVNRNKWGASICVGSNAVYRRAALEEVGGTAEIGFSEDVHTGFDALNRGWKVRYLPLCLATGVCPDGPRAFFSQQMRWARGSTTLLTNPKFWTSTLSFMQKVCYLSGFMYYSAVSLNIFLAPIAGTLLLAIRPEWFKYWNLAFAIPSILYGIIVMRVWARASYGFNVQHVMTVQSYAYLTAIKDRLFGIELLWAASGDKKVHSTSTKFRNMRILCIMWGFMVIGAMIGVVTWRLVTGFDWWHTIPLQVITLYNFWINHYFMFCNW